MRDPSYELLTRGFTLRPMVAADLPEVTQLVRSTEGLAFWDWETDQNLIRSLSRNPGLSQVALDWKERRGKPEIVGCVIIGEGQMAMVHHLAVKPKARGKGNQIGTHLVRAGLKRLYKTPDAARRVYITTLRANLGAQMFWSKFGANKQAHGDLCVFTLNLLDAAHQNWLES